MNKSILKVSAISLTLLALSSGVSLAAGTTNYGSNQCQPIYGGGDSCVKTPSVEINKTVKDPKSGSFVDNLSVSDAKYRSTETVTFKLSVKNTTGSVVNNVVVKDILPDYVDFVNGIGGKFDANTNTLVITIDTLSANETRDFFVQVKVKSQDQLPGDQNTLCTVNQSTVTVGDKTGQDNSQFCIEKGTPTPTQTPNNPSNPTNPNDTTKGGVTTASTANPTTSKGGLPVYPPTKATTTPPTGPEAIPLFGLIPTAISGVFLRRKSK